MSKNSIKVEMRKISELIPYARNPRKNETAVAKVKSSIQEFGFKQPIVVDDKGVIVVGHTRFMAAIELHLEEVPVIVASDLTPNQIKAYRIADNRVAQESAWDDDLLSMELHDLKADDYDLDLTGFDPGQLGPLLDGGFVEEKKEKEEKEYEQKFEIAVECADEADQDAVFKLMTSKGYKCRVLSM